MRQVNGIGTSRRNDSDNSDRNSRYISRSRFGDYNTDARVYIDQGAKTQYGVRRDVGKKQVDGEAAPVEDTGNKVSFYFTNFLDFMLVFQLRQFFKVCGILSDAYIARKRNFSRSDLWFFTLSECKEQR